MITYYNYFFDIKKYYIYIYIMQHQDWTPVVLRKNKTKKKKLATPGEYVTVVKTSASKNKQPWILIYAN